MLLELSVPFAPELDQTSLLEAIPSQPAVFALHLRAVEGVAAPPYLGRTQDLRRRLARLLGPSRSLSRWLNLRELTQRIEYQPVGSQLEALWLLYLLNRAHYPRHYRQRLRLKAPAVLKVNLRNRFPRCYPIQRTASRTTAPSTTALSPHAPPRNDLPPTSSTSSRCGAASKT